MFDYEAKAKEIHETKALLLMATDLMSCVLNKTPGEQGADITFGNSQRFGVPLGYGGSHAAFFASLDKLKFKLPGRIIGVSKDVHGKLAYRMAMQTRE